MGDRDTSIREGCRGVDGNLIIISWNIEGMTDIKLHEICMYMESNSVDIMCIQKGRRLQSDTFKNDAGYSVYLSASGTGSREWAGVGFIIAPCMRQSVLGFLQVHD